MSKERISIVVLAGCVCILILAYFLQVGKTNKADRQIVSLQLSIAAMKGEHKKAIEDAKSREDGLLGQVNSLENQISLIKAELRHEKALVAEAKEETEAALDLVKAAKARAAKAEAESRRLQTELTALKSYVGNFIKTTQEVRESLVKGNQEIDRMIISVAQSRKKIAEMNRKIDKLLK